MNGEVTAGDPRGAGADLIAAAGVRAAELGAPERAVADADPVAIVYTAEAPLAVVALEPDAEGLRTAAARAVRACQGGGTISQFNARKSTCDTSVICPWTAGACPPNRLIR